MMGLLVLLAISEEGAALPTTIHFVSFVSFVVKRSLA
jgi:hypothetical protein